MTRAARTPTMNNLRLFHPAPLALPACLDATQLDRLKGELLRRRGADVLIDGSTLKEAGALGVQLLLAAQALWRSDGRKLGVVNPSRILVELLDGLDADVLMAQPATMACDPSPPDAGAAGYLQWRVDLAPTAAGLARGHEPLAILARLRTLGACWAARLATPSPNLVLCDPMTPRMAWSILLETHADVDDIWAVLQGVADPADVTVTPARRAGAAPVGVVDLVARLEAAASALTPHQCRNALPA